ncbi:MAG: YbjN domain-containing protein [Haloarculaceae archaeon]
MGDKRHALHTRRGLRLSTPSGDEFRVETAWFWAGPPATMRALLDWQQWERAARDGLFGLDDETTPTELIPDTEVVIEARLDPSAEATVPDDDQSLRARLADPDDPLARTETWVATDVRQHERLPEATDLTEAVFADDPDRRAGTREFRLRQVSPGVRVAERREDADGGSTDTGDAAVEDRTTGTTGTDSEHAASVDVGELVSDNETANPEVPPALGPVVDELDEAGWPYEVDADGSRLSLVATLDGHAWDIRVEPAESDERCTATSVHPDRLPEGERGALAARLLAYNASVDGGGFELESETGEVRFRTSFVPGTVPVRDVLGDHATAMAEWYDRIAG